ncbi:MAG: SPOR domain-containing protein [Sphingosinicella sp.]|nr:SPOR domain-containing protein [Sphingosinicella sp.]
MIMLVILGLVVLGAGIGGYNMWSQLGATEGHGELIAAEAGPYKVKPDDPGGMEVEGEGDAAFAASEGAEPQGRIDTGAVSEEPMVAPKPREKPAIPPEEASDLIAPRGPAGAAGTIQLGAFSNEASANSAWKTLAERFAYLASLNHSIFAVKNGEKTLYRLRASGADAASLCGRLRVAGESCVSVN